jgi:squalene cyclase
MAGLLANLRGRPEERPAEGLEITAFATSDGQPHRVGERRTWSLTLRNRAPAALHDVVAVFNPGPLRFEVARMAIGSVNAQETRRANYVITADAAGAFSLSLTLEYRATPGGPIRREERQVAVRIDGAPAGAGEQRLDEVLQGAVGQLLALQNPDGTWAGGIMFNSWTNGMYCILHRVMGLPGEPGAALDWLENHRSGQDANGQSNGTWGIVDDPSLNFLEGTIVAEIALEIWGRGVRQEPWDFINQEATGRLASAMSLADPFTQMFAALASPFAPPGMGPYYSVSDILAPPLELMLVPRFLKSSLPHLFGAWGQDAVLGLMIMTTAASGQPVSLAKQVLLKKAEARLLRSQNEDGSWYGTILPSMAGTMAIYLLGYDIEHPVLQKAVGFLTALQRSDGYISRYKLPVWDTSLAVIALRAAGVEPDSPALRDAAQYLMASQTVVDGGVPFQRENPLYPDTDDTSFMILALNSLDLGELEGAKRVAIARGLRWLLYMQEDEGGWGAFSKGQSKPVRGRIPVFKDDPATPDVTGHVISGLSLGPLVGETRAAQEAIERGIAWLKQMQMDRGEWFGRWGLTYTYGTTAVLQGLHDVGEDMNREYVEMAVDYLVGAQQADGGWGEGYATYYNFAARETPPSTIEQTAWSLLGLLVVPRTPRVEQAITRGVQFLVDRYDPTGRWPESGYTAGALWIYKNTIYPLLWGIWALGLYRGHPSGLAPDAHPLELAGR